MKELLASLYLVAVFLIYGVSFFGLLFIRGMWDNFVTGWLFGAAAVTGLGVVAVFRWALERKK